METTECVFPEALVNFQADIIHKFNQTYFSHILRISNKYLLGYVPNTSSIEKIGHKAAVSLITSNIIQSRCIVIVVKKLTGCRILSDDLSRTHIFHWTIHIAHIWLARNPTMSFIKIVVGYKHLINETSFGTVYMSYCL